VNGVILGLQMTEEAIFIEVAGFGADGANKIKAFFGGLVLELTLGK